MCDGFLERSVEIVSVLVVSMLGHHDTGISRVEKLSLTGSRDGCGRSVFNSCVAVDWLIRH